MQDVILFLEACEVHGRGVVSVVEKVRVLLRLLVCVNSACVQEFGVRVCRSAAVCACASVRQ